MANDDIFCMMYFDSFGHSYEHFLIRICVRDKYEDLLKRDDSNNWFFIFNILDSDIFKYALEEYALDEHIQ